jgi:predicted O-methyltransferase YrrM
MQIARVIAKRVLSPSMHHHLADIVGTAMLSRVPRQELDTSALRRANTIHLSAVFRDEQIARAWDEDFASIFNRWHSGTGAGSVNRGDCRAIYYLVAALKPKKVIEIGTNVAGSSVFIAAAQRSHCGPGSKLTTVDIVDVNTPSGPWSRTDMKQPPAASIADFGLAERVEFVVQPALDFLGSARDADLIFLDGSHAHNDVYRELARATKALAKGGVILLHDYYPAGRPFFEGSRALKGPFRAVERYRSEGAPIRVVPFGELPWQTRKGEDGSFSSLALFLAA